MISRRSQSNPNRYRCLPYPLVLAQLTDSVSVYCISPALTWTINVIVTNLLLEWFFFFVTLKQLSTYYLSGSYPKVCWTALSCGTLICALRVGRLSTIKRSQWEASKYLHVFAFPHSVVLLSFSQASKGRLILQVSFVVMVRTTKPVYNVLWRSWSSLWHHMSNLGVFSNLWSFFFWYETVDGNLLSLVRSTNFY